MRYSPGLHLMPVHDDHIVSCNRPFKGALVESQNEPARIHELGRVVNEVSRAYHGDRNAVRSFLYRPHPLLKGKTPFDVARSSSAGTKAVLDLIRRAEASVAL